MIVALITARGGSKGLPRKNVLDLNGKPLINWTIMAALESEAVEKVFVSTEDEEIKEISLSCGAEIIDRPDKLAQDFSTSEAVVEHAVNYLNTSSLTVVLLQPTSPLRTSKHIDEAIDVYKEKQCSCVISVFEPSFNIAKAYVQEPNGSIKGFLSNDSPYKRRQETPKTFLPNGAIYIFSAEAFIAEGCKIPRKEVYPYVMPSGLSKDIDSYEDFLECSLKMYKEEM